QPQSRTVYAGSNVLFSVCASGQTPLAYLWRHNGDLLAQTSNSPSYLVKYALPEDAGNYDVVVTNAAGSTTSAVASLTGLVTTPAIISNPQNVSASYGQTAMFTVGAAGAPPPAYQWQKNGLDLPSETNSNLVLANVMPADAGSYAAVTYNIAGSITSASARL